MIILYFFIKDLFILMRNKRFIVTCEVREAKTIDIKYKSKFLRDSNLAHKPIKNIL